MEASVVCIQKKCVYAVDWEDYPETTGYSMYKFGGHNQFGCMRAVAQINGKPLKPCAIKMIEPKQLVLL